jgi:hypothetical protein
VLTPDDVLKTATTNFLSLFYNHDGLWGQLDFRSAIVDQEKNAKDVWTSLISLHQATGFRTVLTYMRTFYTMRAAEDENIPEYINKMKTIVDEINAMKSRFKVDDITYAGVLAQSLPATWNPFIDNLFHGDFTEDEDPPPLINARVTNCAILELQD